MSEWSLSSRRVHLRGENVFGNKFYGYAENEVGLPDGRTAKYFGLDVGPCVHVVGLTQDETTLLVRQKRPNLLRDGDMEIPTTLELPGGFAHPNRPLEESATSEFGEETGRLVSDLQLVTSICPSTGLSNERDTVFWGSAGDAGSWNSDRHIIEATEQDMRIIEVPFGRAIDIIRRGSEPISAQTVAALALVATMIK
jgi:8-oxo-dGTP pyrophosphatase MutT (NUDIX family)